MKKIFYISICTLLLIATSCYVFASEKYHFEINGVSGDARKNVETHLETLKSSAFTKQEFLQQAPEQIRKALQPFGYFKTSVTTEIANTSNFHFAINLGPILKISNVDVKLNGIGKDNLEIKKYIDQFPLQPGQTLEIDRYNKTKDQLFQILHDQGFLKAVLEKKEIRVNLKKYTASIILHIDTGPRYYFGHVLFNENPFSKAFLQRFVTIKENEPYSSQKLLKFKTDLINSHYFQQVEAIPDIDQAERNHLPIKVSLTPPKSQRYDIGIGYGTFTGPRLTLGTDFRRVTDSGQHFNAQLKLSSVLSRLAAKYYIPGKNPLTDQYTIGLNVQHFAPQNGTSFSQTLSGSFQKTKEEWQNTFSINYLNERYRIKEESTHISQLLYPNVTISRVKTDNLLAPKFGNLFNFSVQGASQNLLSKTDFFQAEVKGKYIFSPTNNSRVIFRGDWGYTVVDNLNQLPLSMRYFAGGIGSVRGYPYSSIGPGKYLQVGSAEFQHKIIGDWHGAVFYDVGNASNEFNSNFKRGDGLGLIYQSFIGPIKLYVGRGLSNPGKPLTVEFSIGPDF